VLPPSGPDPSPGKRGGAVAPAFREAPGRVTAEHQREGAVHDGERHFRPRGRLCDGDTQRDPLLTPASLLLWWMIKTVQDKAHMNKKPREQIPSVYTTARCGSLAAGNYEGPRGYIHQ